MRRLYYKYVKHGGLVSAWQHGDIKLNWPLVARLIELSYRCNLCRRCAQTCPIGADNGLVAHELRKLFSQEMGIAAKEIHDTGSMLQLKVGSSTGMNAVVVKDNIEFIDEDMTEKTGIEVKTPWDVEGADVLLIHNAGRNSGVARKSRRLRIDPECGRNQLDSFLRNRGLRFHQLRSLVRRRASSRA